MNLENLLSKNANHERPHIVIPLTCNVQKSKFIDTASRLVLLENLEVIGKWKVTANEGIHLSNRML